MKPALTVEENLRFWRDFMAEADNAAGATGAIGAAGATSAGKLTVQEALEKMDIGGLGALAVARLSIGQARRAALARLFLFHRPLWVLDEPETGLDDESRARLEKAVRDHMEEGGIAVIAGRDSFDLPQKRVLALDGGDGGDGGDGRG